MNGAVRQIAAILLLPGMVTVAIPAVMIHQSRGIRLGWGPPWPDNLVPSSKGVSAPYRTQARRSQTGEEQSYRGTPTMSSYGKTRLRQGVMLPCDRDAAQDIPAPGAPAMYFSKSLM